MHAGGRLYCTALAAMTLEVYYRYMPLYRPQAHQGERYRDALAVSRFSPPHRKLAFAVHVIPVLDLMAGLVVRGVGGRAR